MRSSVARVGRSISIGVRRPPCRRASRTGIVAALALAALVPAAQASLRAYTWGKNSGGELGNGTMTPTNVPGAISLSKVKSVAAGDTFSLVLLSNGTVKSFGVGYSGQLGNGKAEVSDVPVTVSGLSGVKAITAGRSSGLALETNGTVWAWGSYEYGQTTNQYENTFTPVEILSGVKAISSEGAHDLALLNNGTVLAWGRDGNGELGLGNTEEYVVAKPTAVPGLTGVKAIGTGEYHSLAVLGKGTVDAWGDNESGQLGNGKTAEAVVDTPQPVPGLSKVKAVVAGSYFSLALLSNGTAMGWGQNANGELGDGEMGVNVDKPVPVSGLTEAKALAAHESWAMALRKSGGVMSWGSDYEGELGLGGGSGTDVPTSIGGLSGAKAIAAGFGFGLAVAR